MTLSITNQDPPQSDFVSSSVRPRFSIVTDDLEAPVDLVTVNVWFDGKQLIVDGDPQEGSTIESNGLGGYDIVLVDRFLRIEENSSVIKVDAYDMNAVLFTDTWTFLIEEKHGPALTDQVPAPGEIVAASPSTIDFRIYDQGDWYAPSLRLLHGEHSSVDLNWAADLPTGPGTPDHQALFDRSFSGNGRIIAGTDEFEALFGSYTFTRSDVGKTVTANGDDWKVVNFISSGKVQVDRVSPDGFSLADWSLKGHRLGSDMVGAVMKVVSGAETGETRLITGIDGSGVLTYDGAQLTTVADVEIYRKDGLDVWIDGVRVIRAGEADPDAVIAGWTPITITTLGSGDIDVSITVPVSWNRGDKPMVHVRCGDDSYFDPVLSTGYLNVSDLHYSFQVQGTQGPRVTGITPAPGSKGLGLSDNLQFDVIPDAGDVVALADVDVQINGVAAMTAGVGVGNWNTSTNVASPVDPNGRRIVIIPNAAYSDGETVFVEIDSVDDVPLTGEKRVYNVQFGTGVGSTSVPHGLGVNVIRVDSFDYSNTPFGDPVGLDHTGYAWDGFWYDSGDRDASNVASWFTELGSFPLSGHVVFTSDAGWAIVKAEDSGAWMSCAPAASGWSMAGITAMPMQDGAMGQRDAVLSHAGNDVYMVDFTTDLAYRYNNQGRLESAKTIVDRGDDQSGNFYDNDYVLPAGPYNVVALDAWPENRLIVTKDSTGATFINELSGEFQTQALALRTAESIPKIATVAVTGTPVRFAIEKWDDSIWPVLLGMSVSSQAQIHVYDIIEAMTGSGSRIFLDDMSTPTLPAADLKDLDVVMAEDEFGDTELVFGIAYPAQGDILTYDLSSPAASTIDSHSDTDMGVNGTGDIGALALEPGFRVSDGFFYVATTGAGRVVRFRQHSPAAANRSVQLSDGTPFSTLAPIGRTATQEISYVQSSMKLVDP